MAAAAGDDRVGKSTFRCLDLVRYVVASVVVVLIFTVIVKSIMVVLRPDTLALSVLGGTVFTKRLPPPPDEKLQFELDLYVSNPNSRTRMYIVNATAYLFDKNTPASTTDPEDDSIFLFNPSDSFLPQMKGIEDDTILPVTNDPDSINTTYFKMLYNNGDHIYGVTLRVDASVITEIKYGYNTSARRTTYYCRPLVVGGDRDDEASQRDNVPCTGNQMN